VSRAHLTSRAPLLAVAVVAAAAIAVTASAQSSERKIILHEDVAPPADRVAAADAVKPHQQVFGDDPTEGQNPSAIGANNKILPEPGDKAPSEDEPILGQPGFAADRDTRWNPDYHTGADGTLQYVVVFNPSILPFKRMSSMDSVSEDYTLFTSRSALQDIPVGGQKRADRDLFWGSLSIALTPGEDVAIPSVSPDMGVLSYEVEPKTRLTFSKDSADNFYVRSDESGAHGVHRLVFLADASASYFAPSIPKRIRVRDVETGMVPELPKNVSIQAQRALKSLGLNRNMYLDQALDKLVYYFRAFEAKASPPDTGNVFWDLFSSQAGVCRHRSFAFMIVANELGIPTRYITNEAHAWAEIFLPRTGWVRLDLGGAALRLEVDNGENKSMYRPRGEDPFAQPPSYAQNYTRLEGDINGLTDDQIAEAQAPLPEGDGSGDGSGSGSGGDFDPPAADGAETDDGRLTGPGSGLPEIPAEELVDKTPTSISVSEASSVGYRGESIEVKGTLTDGDGVALAGQRVDIFVAPAGNDGNDALLIGHGISKADGSYSAKVTLPAELDLTDYEVFAATPGNDKYQPSVSQ
jgi:hypothetical protein